VTARSNVPSTGLEMSSSPHLSWRRPAPRRYAIYLLPLS